MKGGRDAEPGKSIIITIASDGVTRVFLHRSRKRV